MDIFGSFRKKRISREDIRKEQKSTSGKWQVGDRIANQYEIYQILGGEGKTGMGIVYICYDHKHKTPYALKTFQEKYLFSEEAIKLFEREALIWTELERYPYIVHAHWVERAEGRLFIVLEYIAPDSEGRNTLTHYLGNLSFPEILKFSIQFCYGMEYAYSKGIDAHRDIKPDNIMITADKTVKITDFGLAKAFQEIQLTEDIISKEERPGLSIFKSKGKRICGTLPYIAPEQFDGYADIRSDIYSFGIVLYQTVSEGRVPFIGRTSQEYEILHKYEKIPTISSPLFPIIQKCLEKEPEKRFQDFTAIREELQRLLLKETGERITLPEKKELEAWELVNKGVALGNLGRYQEAINCCDKALQIDPRYAVAWINKGVSLGNFGRYQEEINCYDKALQIDPRHAEIWNNKGAALNELGRYEEAINCYDKALQIDPRHAEIWNNKGAALRNLGRYEEAINCCDKALQIDPRHAAAWINKGLASGNLGRYEEAINCCDKALQIDPVYAAAWTGKGLALYVLGRYQEATNCYDKALQIDPRHAEIWNNKGLALGNLGRYEEAINCYDKALQIDPRYADAWYNKGFALYELGRYQEAISCFDEAIRLNPNFPQAHRLKQLIEELRR